MDKEASLRLARLALGALAVAFVYVIIFALLGFVLIAMAHVVVQVTRLVVDGLWRIPVGMGLAVLGASAVVAGFFRFTTWALVRLETRKAFDGDIATLYEEDDS